MGEKNLTSQFSFGRYTKEKRMKGSYLCFFGFTIKRTVVTTNNPPISEWDGISK